MHLIHIIPGGLTAAAVCCDTPPDLILHNEHTELLHLLAQFLDIIADDAVVDVYIGTVVEQVQGAFHIDFQSRSNMVGFLLVLLEQGVVQVLKNGHILRVGICKIFAVNQMHTAVNDRFLHRQQPFLAAYHQFTQRKNKVGFQGQWVIFLRVVGVNIHGVDKLGTVGADFDDLTFQPVHQRRVFAFGVVDDNIIVCDQKFVNLALTGYLNGTDIKFIRSLKNLQRLDISEARIVEGGDKYYENYLTADDVTGDYMFYNLPNLTHLALSNHTTEIAAAALNSCTGLTEIEIPASVRSVGKSAFNNCNQLLLINWNAQAAITAESFDTPAKMGNLLIFAPEGTGCTYEGNVVINGMAEKISLTHGKGFRSPQAFKAKDITYKRNFSMKSGNKINAAGWEAIVLPFDVQSFSNEKQGELAPFNSGKKGVKPFWLAQMTTDGFEHTTAMKANKPYIISLPNSESYEDEFNISGEVQFHAEDADGVEVKATSYKELARIEGSNRIMVPAYETVFKHDTVYAINPATYEDIAPGGAFVRNLRDVQPFEAYLISKEAAINAPKLYSIGGIGGEITGIEELPSDALDGIEIYVRYGVLYIKSDRERTLSIYDTAGHMVRQVEVQEGTTAVTGLGKGIYLLARKKILVQ